jgi:hypothetical protein
MTAQQLQQPVQPSLDAAAINAGTKVYSHNGDQLGIVGDVWAYIPPYGYVAKSKFAVANYGPIRGTMHLSKERADMSRSFSARACAVRATTISTYPGSSPKRRGRPGLVVSFLGTDDARFRDAIAV